MILVIDQSSRCCTTLLWQHAKGDKCQYLQLGSKRKFIAAEPASRKEAMQSHYSAAGFTGRCEKSLMGQIESNHSRVEMRDNSAELRIHVVRQDNIGIVQTDT